MYKKLFCLLVLSLSIVRCGYAQGKYVYTIKADSVKITNCDSAELILENHTQGVPGFLFNTGNGRTIFKRGVQNAGGNNYVFGADTLQLATNPWLLTGNAPDTIGVFGTWNYQPFEIYTDGIFRARWSTFGGLAIGSNYEDPNHLLTVSSDMLVNGLTVGRGSGSNIYNAALGSDALINNTTGSVNTCVGSQSSSNVRDGSANTTMGAYAMYGNYSGSSNTALGYYAGFECVGSGNVFLGNGAGENTSNLNNKLYIADNGVTTLIYGDFNTGQVQINGGTGNFLSTSNFIVSGDSFLSDSLTLNTVRTGTSLDSVLTISNGVVHKIAQSSLAFNGAINSSLAANGDITAKRLRLSQRNWPDYVFDSSYRLPALKEVEDSIRQRHHLPGIASAVEVRKDGADVGENQAVFLKKVEELTLYTIQQDHEIESLKKGMVELRQLITSKSEK